MQNIIINLSILIYSGLIGRKEIKLLEVLSVDLEDLVVQALFRLIKLFIDSCLFQDWSEQEVPIHLVCPPQECEVFDDLDENVIDELGAGNLSLENHLILGKSQMRLFALAVLEVTSLELVSLEVVQSSN